MTTEIILKEAQERISQIEGYPVVLRVRPANLSKIDRLKESISEAFQLPWLEILKRNKTGERALARGLFLYICTVDFSMGLEASADHLGMDHSTVIYHRNKVRIQLAIGDDIYTRRYNQVKHLINN